VVSVPRAWPGETVVILATGPSLTVADVEYCGGRARVLAINDAYTLAPFADCLYGTDAKWWNWHRGAPSFTGPKWSVEHSQWNAHRVKYPDVQRLRNTGNYGIDHEPTGLRTGRNSGYAAINLAVHYGAARIVLLGYDMQPRHGQTHFFGEHPQRSPSPYASFRAAFDHLVKPLAKLGIVTVNASRESLLTCFPRVDLRDALAVALTRSA
jgi:hypothetical protein